MNRAGTITTVVAATLFGVIGGAALERRYHRCPEPVMKQRLEDSVRTYTVERYVDGDTVDVEEGVEVLLYRIRLAGIDTPEKGKPLCKEATQTLAQLVGGRKIILEKDPSKETGNFGRPLRYIVVDGKNLNIELVRLGYAELKYHEGLKYENEFIAAEKEAKENKRGLWAGFE